MIDSEDAELLETYLDGALAPAVARRVDARLKLDPALASSLEDLRASRAERALAFDTLEPDDAAAKQFAERTLASLHRREWQCRLVRRSGAAAAIVACLGAGFVAGWIGRGRSQPAGVAHTAHHDAQIILHTPSNGAASPDRRVYSDDPSTQGEH